MQRCCLIAIVALAIILCGCANRLSRSRAQELLVRKLGLPQPQTVKIFKAYSKRTWSDPVVGFGTVTICVNYGDADQQFGNMEPKLNRWVSGGLLQLTDTTGRTGRCNYISANAQLTDEGRKYLLRESKDVYEARLYDLVFGEVTGMQVREELKVAEVEYTLERSNFTPFALVLGEGSTEPISRKAVFALYDDGWRVGDGN